MALSSGSQHWPLKQTQSTLNRIYLDPGRHHDYKGELEPYNALYHCRNYKESTDPIHLHPH